ncbi:tetratricopeptide repeat protein [Phytohabitans sp. ZYX-F-186]|uniref:Tetratricopeptide repeat protein n=1 Tax=Phytohabitans maris TaxID=3071409 RepID=A0ABU0ZMJ0_9ACTN|nr:tetratricopeptide repeat protein [Phytohabitans sp. ZYX-F-186]
MASPAAFVALLRMMKAWAGNPSFDRLARLSGVPRSTLADALSRRRSGLPALDVVRRLVAACGADAEGVRGWEAAWLRLQQAGTGDATDRAGTERARPWPVPALLPADAADFVGRDKDVAWLTALLAPGAGGVAPVVSAVAGRAGVGKTALALRVAHRVAAGFPDGQLYADLRGASAEPADPVSVLGRFLRWLGVDGAAVPAEPEERAALFRALLAERRVLVVLDDAGSAAQVRPLLPGSGPCAVLVTSRSRLTELAGVKRLDLDVLEPPEALDLLGALVGREAVTEDPAAAYRIGELCGFLPLAVRIAGARLAARPHRGLGWLAGRLADGRRRLGELTAGDLDVRSSLALSYRSLGPGAARALRALSIVDIPDFAAWIAGPLLDVRPEEAEELVDVLAEAYLVDPVGTDATGRTRFRLHDLVRLCAREFGAREETEADRRAALTRLAGAWLAAAEEATSRLPGRELPRIPSPAGRYPVPPDVLAELAAGPAGWFDAERAGLVSAVEACCAAGLTAHAWALAAACSTYLDARGYYDDGLRLCRLVLRHCQAAGDGLGEATMLMALGVLWSNGPEAGEEDHMAVVSRAAELFAAHGEPRGRAKALELMSFFHQKHGRPEEAIRRVDEALATEAGADPELAGDLWLSRAMALQLQGRRDEAEAAYLRALDSLRGRGAPVREAITLRALASLYRRGGDPDAAQLRLRQALAILNEREHASAWAATMLTLGQVLADQGHPQAQETLESALAACRRLRVGFGEGLALMALGDLHRRQRRPELAVRLCTEALAIAEGLDGPPLRAWVLRALGDAQQASGAETAARDAWTRARTVYARLGDHAAVGQLDALLT